MKILNFILENIEETKNSLKNFKSQTLSSLAQLIPIGMVLVSIVGFIIGIIKFVLSGGFSNQISLLNGDLFGGFSKGFTYGTVGILISGIVPKIISVFILLELVVLLVLYYKTENKIKKIIVSICLGLIVIFFNGILLILGMINISKPAQVKIMEMLIVFEGIKLSGGSNGLVLMGIIFIIAFIVFLVLIFISEYKWVIKKSMLALLLSYIVFPLALLLVENIIPIIIGIIVFLMIIGVAIIIFKSNGVSGIRDYSNSGENSSKSHYKENKPKKEHQKVERFDLDNTLFWKDKGSGLGIFTPSPLVDCIYVKNHFGQKDYVCTVYDFEKGNVAIINKGVRIINIAGCKMPER